MLLHLIGYLLVLLPFALSQSNDTDHLTKISNWGHRNQSLDIEQLLIGLPLVGAVEEGEVRLVHFGVTPRDDAFPDITFYLEAVDSDAEVELYCNPSNQNYDHVPTKHNASWVSTNRGEIFISSKSKAYYNSLTKKYKDGEQIDVAAFDCAIKGVSGGETNFQLTIQLSFDERKLVTWEKGAMKYIFRKCCSAKDSCERWMLKEQSSKATNELVEFDFCHRMGSICNQRGHLTRLDLRGYGLKCKIPMDGLLKLTHLETLDLSDNSIHADTGEHVVQFKQLKNLKDLSLKNNFVYGELDVDGLCSELLKNLRTLDLEGNFVSGRIPSCVYRESANLLEIYLSRNSLSGYLSDLFPVSSPLKAFAASDNGLTGVLPSSLGKLKNLKVLNLDGNSFNGQLPDSFTGLNKIQVLDLSNNRLSSLPTSWSSIWDPPESLRILKLNKNKLRGELPIRLLDAEHLEWLDLSDNELTGRLFSKKDMFPKLVHFNLSTNNFEGYIPEEFSSMGVFSPEARFSPDHVFDLSFNNLTGEIPDFLYEEVTPNVADVDVVLKGNNFVCPHDQRLNSDHTFECSEAVEKPAEAAPKLALANHDQSKDSPLVKNRKELDEDEGDESEGEQKTDVFIAVVATVLAVSMLAVVIGLVALHKKRRYRSLGFEYGTPDEIVSDDGIQNKPAEN